MPENLAMAHSMYHAIANDEDSPKCAHALLNLGKTNYQLSISDFSGNFYWLGQGVQTDISEAIKLYQKSADRGLPDAQHRLGEIYKFGKSVPKDLDLAIFYFRQAADQGYKDSHFKLGMLPSCSDN